MPGSASWMQGRARWMPGRARFMPGRASWMPGRALWIPGRPRFMSGRAHLCRPARINAGPRTLDRARLMLGRACSAYEGTSTRVGPPSPRTMRDIAARWLMAAPLLLRPYLCCWGNDLNETPAALARAKGWESTKHCRQYCTTLKTL